MILLLLILGTPPPPSPPQTATYAVFQQLIQTKTSKQAETILRQDDAFTQTRTGLIAKVQTLAWVWSGDDLEIVGYETIKGGRIISVRYRSSDGKFFYRWDGSSIHIVPTKGLQEDLYSKNFRQ